MSTVRTTTQTERAAYLATIPPSQRSEAAARYDHQLEADRLATDLMTDVEIESARMQVWRADVAAKLAESGGYRCIAGRYLTGARTSPGMERAIVEAEVTTPYPTRDEGEQLAREMRTRRLEYIRQRYGVKPRILA